MAVARSPSARFEPRPSSGTVSNKDEADLGLRGAKELKSVIKVQCFIRRYLARKEYKARPDADKVASDKKHKPIIEPAKFEKIFNPNISVIRQYNTNLMTGLEAVMKDWKPASGIGAVFVPRLPFFKSYTHYVNLFDQAISTLNGELENKKNQKLAVFLDDLRFKEKRTQQLTLDALLVQPVQRLPRYALLLDELLDNTWKAHQDYELLSKAVVEIKKITAYVNENKRERENLAKVNEIYNRLDGKEEDKAHLLKGRRYVREGQIIEISDPDKPKEYYLFLLSDLLVWTKRKMGKKYKIKRMDYLKDLAAQRCRFTAEQQKTLRKQLKEEKSTGVRLTHTQLGSWSFAADEPLSWLNDVATKCVGLITRESPKIFAADFQEKLVAVSTGPTKTQALLKQEKREATRKAMLEERARRAAWLAKDSVEAGPPPPLAVPGPSSRYATFHSVSTRVVRTGWTVPEFAFVGGRGSGKSSLIEALLGFPLYSLVAPTVKPLHIDVVNNPKYAFPRITLRQANGESVVADGKAEPQFVVKPDSSVSRVRVEFADCWDVTLIDCPGLDAKDENALAEIREVVSEPSRTLVFVEPATSYFEHNTAVEYLAEFDPDLRRSIFVSSMAHFLLRDMHSLSELRWWLNHRLRENNFVVSVFPDSFRSTLKTATEFRAACAGADLRDVEACKALGVDPRSQSNFAKGFGLSALRQYIFETAWKTYESILPRQLQVYEQQEQLAVAHRREVEEALKASDVRGLATWLTKDWTMTLRRLTEGSTEADPLQTGLDTWNERFNTNQASWFEQHNLAYLLKEEFFASLSSVDEKIPNAHAKLYGGQQMQRLLTEFSNVANLISVDFLREEVIEAAIGLQDRTVRTTVSSVASSIVQQLVEAIRGMLSPLVLRTVHIMQHTIATLEYALKRQANLEAKRNPQQNSAVALARRGAQGLLVAHLKRISSDYLQAEAEALIVRTQDALQAANFSVWDLADEWLNEDTWWDDEDDEPPGEPIRPEPLKPKAGTTKDEYREYLANLKTYKEWKVGYDSREKERQQARQQRREQGKRRVEERATRHTEEALREAVLGTVRRLFTQTRDAYVNQITTAAYDFYITLMQQDLLRHVYSEIALQTPEELRNLLQIDAFHAALERERTRLANDLSTFQANRKHLAEVIASTL